MYKDKALACAAHAARFGIPYVAIKASNGQWMRERQEYADKHYPIDAPRVTFHPKETTMALREDITLKELHEHTQTLETRLSMEIQAAVEDFKKITGITPSNINVSMMDTTSVGDPISEFTVVQTEVSRDEFPRF